MSKADSAARWIDSRRSLRSRHATCLAPSSEDFPGDTGAGLQGQFTNPPPIDFVSFWNAARLVVQGEAADVHSSQPSSFGPLLPIAYPPPFLFLIAPFGLIAFGLAFLAWTVMTGALYLHRCGAKQAGCVGLAARTSEWSRRSERVPYGRIFLLGLRWLPTRPIFAGVILGLMVIKPQLGLLLPIALLAGRHWTALLGATISSLALLILAAAHFGFQAYQAFVEALAHYSFLLESGRWPWNELASIYALLRWCGADGSIALVVHLGTATFSEVITWLAWRANWDSKVPVVAAASLLSSPYLFTYDAVLLVAPLAWLTLRAPWWSTAIWCLALLPLLRIVGYARPNGVSLAAISCLVALVILQRRTKLPLRRGIDWP